MTKQTSKSIVSRLALASVCFLWLAGCTGGVKLGPDAVAGKVPERQPRCDRDSPGQPGEDSNG